MRSWFSFKACKRLEPKWGGWFVLLITTLSDCVARNYSMTRYQFHWRAHRAR